MTQRRNSLKRQLDYVAIARDVCKILDINASGKELVALLESLETWADSGVYCTSTQKDIIENVREIVKDIRENKDADSILQKVEKLEKDISYDRDFD